MATALGFARIVLVGEAPVTAGPGDQMSAGAAGRGRLRASHADREQVIDVLKVAFVQGRLTKDELDARVGQTFTARTYADLAVITADIPAHLIGAPLPRQPARAQARPPMSHAAKLGICAVIALATMTVGAHLTDGAALILFVSFYFLASFAAGSQALCSWHEKRSSGQLPPRPGPNAGGRASQRSASAAEAEQLGPAKQGQRHAPEAARKRPPRQQLSSSRPLRQWRHRGRRYAIGYADH